VMSAAASNPWLGRSLITGSIARYAPASRRRPIDAAWCSPPRLAMIRLWGRLPQTRHAPDPCQAPMQRRPDCLSATSPTAIGAPLAAAPRPFAACLVPRGAFCAD
jgi:hypothetical protein